LDHFLLITFDFFVKKKLELIYSTWLSSNPGSATGAELRRTAAVLPTKAAWTKGSPLGYQSK
jgi:hypothetical protein